jgi:3-deoxy-D-manno-octulosonic-acid transferase
LSRPQPLPAFLAAYGLATRLVEPWAPVLLKRRVARGKEDPERLGERFGRTGVARPDGPLVWLHGASVGETLSLLSLIEAMRAARPALNILVTSGTKTSAEMMARRLPPGAIHQYVPVDGPKATAAFLDHWRPDLGVFVEGELWPNLLLTAQARGVRLTLLSAKLSQPSFRRWKRAKGAIRRLYSVFDLILAQSDSAAFYLKALGVETAGVGDLKFGHPPLPVDEAALAARRSEVGERPVILAVSTHPGEEKFIAAGFTAIAKNFTQPLLVIAPRHPDRGEAVADEMAAMGFRTGRQGAGDGLAQAQVFVADRLGEMGLWLRLASLAVMGGSFTRGVGGHNPLEPARLGVPLASGIHVDNWDSAYDLLYEEGVVDWMSTRQAVEQGLTRVLIDREGLAEEAARARALVEAQDLAARAVLDRVVELLP